MTNTSCSDKLIIVGIIAHNEEGIIEIAINGILKQKIPNQYMKKIFIITNACTDNTEEIVMRMAHINPEIKLISLRKKGKAYALRTFIETLNENFGNQRDNVDQNIVLLDADVKMEDEHTLMKLYYNLQKENSMDALIAKWLPESVFNSKKDLISNLYRVLYKLQGEVRSERFRGMCYIIRLNVINQIPIFDNVLSEDQYFQYKLRGRYKIVDDIRVVYRIPKSLKEEFRRRQRHAIALTQIRELYKIGMLEQIYGGDKDDVDIYKISPRKAVFELFKKVSFRERIYLVIIVIIRIVTVFRAKGLYRKLNNDEQNFNGIWETNR